MGLADGSPSWVHELRATRQPETIERSGWG